METSNYEVVAVRHAIVAIDIFHQRVGFQADVKIYSGDRCAPRVQIYPDGNEAMRILVEGCLRELYMATIEDHLQHNPRFIDEAFANFCKAHGDDCHHCPLKYGTATRNDCRRVFPKLDAKFEVVRK